MWGKNSWYLGIIFLILLCGYVYANSVRINEIYVEGTSKYEWVELYNYGNKSVNLTNWQFGDSSDKDEILGELILEPKNYALLTSDSTYVYFLWDIGNCNKLYVKGALGNGLNDKGDKIYLYNESDDVVDSLDYPNLDGKVYVLNESGDWNFAVNGTPGYANFYTEICDPYIDIFLDKLIYNENETIYFTPKVYGVSDYEIEYWIEDLEENIVKNKRTTTNSNPKQWSPDIDKEEQAFIIKANLTYSDCKDSNLENNFVKKLIAVLRSEVSRIQNYDVLKINELFPDPEGNDNAAMPEGEWIELYNSGNEALDLENLSLKDNYGQEHDIFISNTNTIDGTIINPKGYLIVYMNGRSGFLNNDGFEKISLYKDDYLIDEVSYSGSIEGLSWGKIEDVWRLTLPTPGSENFYNESINESRLEIEKIYENKIKFGEIIRVKISVYKGNTDKYSIQAWVEDKNANKISKKSRASVYKKFNNYDFVLPVSIFSDCENGYNEGDYYVVVEGLGLRDKKEIKIKGNDESLCKIIKEEIVREVGSSTTRISEKDIKAEYDISYISKEVKEKRLAVYFFCVILIFMLIYLGLRNE